MSDLVLGLKATAERINVPEKTLRHWRSLGKGPRGVRIGRRVMFRVSDIDAWLDQQFLDA
jgi:predicted DNA-binding transcriptional regulator AlpA